MNKRLIQSVLSVHPKMVNARDLVAEFEHRSDSLYHSDPVGSRYYEARAKTYRQLGNAEVEWFEIHCHRTYDDGSTETVCDGIVLHESEDDNAHHD